ncbi:hypothetical protein [Nostoc sp. MS1]|uniref:hypothetical protein n=1 Tax=Nostoc sp. MS1 TaxID=2764711 RepID=UPI001CC6C220|nr:hypothetical protein [Nostoc sp. MS1]BCL38319.1 hypothetical protein NSMS1_47660 [Nostoc sp. MS1]
MQTITIQNHELLKEISNEESAIVSGGGIETAAAYLTVLRAFNPRLAASPEALNTAFLFLIDVLPAPGSNKSP